MNELLLLLGHTVEDVVGLLHAAGLYLLSASLAEKIRNHFEGMLTPRETGTEKKSTPVALAMASPPGTPGR